MPIDWKGFGFRSERSSPALAVFVTGIAVSAFCWHIAETRGRTEAISKADAAIADARDAIEGCQQLTLATGVICDRVAIKRAAPAGLTVLEYKPFDGKAAEELQQLYTLAFATRR